MSQLAMNFNYEGFSVILKVMSCFRVQPISSLNNT